MREQVHMRRREEGGASRDQYEQLRQDALEAWNHYRITGLHVTAEEADVWLAELEAGENAEPPECHD